MSILRFERKVDFPKLVGSIPGYSVEKISGKAGMGVFVDGRLVAGCFRRRDVYEFLSEENVSCAFKSFYRLIYYWYRSIRHNRRFIGIDSNTQYLELSVKRLKEELENIANNPKPTAELV